MVGTLKEDNYLVHLQGFYKNMAWLPNTQCLAHHPQMVWLKDETKPDSCPIGVSADSCPAGAP